VYTITETALIILITEQSVHRVGYELIL